MLVQCPECNNEISSEAKSCPNCGFKIKQKTNVSNVFGKKYLWIIIAAVVLSFVMIMIFVSKNKSYEKYDGEKFNFTAIYPNNFTIDSSEKRTDLEDIILTDENDAEIMIFACKNNYSGIKAVQKDIQSQNNELYKEEVSDYTYECVGKVSNEIHFCGVYIVNDDDLLFFIINYPKDKEKYYTKIRNKMAEYFKKNNMPKDDDVSKDKEKVDNVAKESDNEQEVQPSFVVEECKRMYEESEEDYIYSDIKVRNKTGKKIKYLTLTVQYLNKNKDIVNETYPQVQGPIDDKQSIAVLSTVEKSLNPYYIRVVKYNYYDATDSGLNNLYSYEDSNPQNMNMDKSDSTSDGDTKKDEEQSEEQKIAKMVIDEVTSHLKAPGTAVFSDSFDISQRKIATTTYYYVSGYVDSENGFGALLRSNFKVTVKKQSDEYEIYKVEFE